MRTLAVLAASLFVAVVLLVFLYEPDTPARTTTTRGTTEAQGVEETPQAPPTAEPVPTGWARVNGVVTGREGPMAGALVGALTRAGEVVAAVASNLEGEYELRIPAGIELALEVRPESFTNLKGQSRTIRAETDETLTEDFALAGERGTAWGTVQGGPSGQLRCFAIPIDQFPVGENGEEPSFGQLEAAPKLSSSPHNDEGFIFYGLEPGTTYGLAIDDARWMLARAVTLRAGDRDILAYAIPALSLYVEVRDIESYELVPEFTVTLRETVFQVKPVLKELQELLGVEPPPLFDAKGEPGTVLTLAGKNGKLKRRIASSAARTTWKLAVAAEGYFEETHDLRRILRLYLQRKREPNATLRLRHDDGTPLDDEVKVSFEAAEDADGVFDARLERVEPGLFRATVPAGRWKLYVHTSALVEPKKVLDIELSAKGSWTGELTFPRGGRLILRGGGYRVVWLQRIERVSLHGEDFEIVRDSFSISVPAEGQRTIVGIPSGIYRVVNGEKVLETIEVSIGSRHEIDLPDPKPDRYRAHLPPDDEEDN